MGTEPSRSDLGKRIADRYTAQACAYKDRWAPLLDGLAEPVLRDIDGTDIKALLDVGTGVGAMLPDLERAFPAATVIGADMSLGMLALAPHRFRLAVMDASRLAIASRSFDLVVLGFVLSHLPEPRVGILEAQRVLRTRGSIAVVTWATELESKATRLWKEQLDEHGASVIEGASEPSQHHLLDSPEKLGALLGSVGFTSVHSWTERHERVIDLEQLVRLRTNLGGGKRGFDSLDARGQAAFLKAVRGRLASLDASGFVASAEVVYGRGRSP